VIDTVLRSQSHLTTRDMTLLGWLADHGVLTSFQIAHALYPSVNFAQRRLRKLTALGVIDRFRPQRPDGGSHPYHYVLAQLGVEVVAAQRGEELPRKDRAKARRWHLTNRANLPHLLGTNEFFIQLAGHARTHQNAALQRWWPATRCAQMGAFADPDDEPNIRLYRAQVRPDGHGIWTEDDRTVPFFAEYDTGTEPLWKVAGKLTGYTELARATGKAWPVLFWLHSARRERNLREELAGQHLPAVVAATAARDHATRLDLSPAETVWALLGDLDDGGRLRLADLPHVTPRPHLLTGAPTELRPAELA
jgi:hypothetical protein